MAYGVEVKELYERIGHDGSQVVWDNHEPFNRRGFHPQELIHAFPEIGVFTPVERFPTLKDPHGEGYRCIPGMGFLFSSVEIGRGVLECRTLNGNHHAVAFNRGDVVDPDDGLLIHSYKLSVEPVLAWVLHPINVHKG